MLIIAMPLLAAPSGRSGLLAPQAVLEVQIDDNERATFAVDENQEDYGAGPWCSLLGDTTAVSCVKALREFVPRALASREEARPQSLIDGTAISTQHSIFNHPDACTDMYHVIGRCMTIRKLLEYVVDGHVPGDYVELGTHVGDSAAVAAHFFVTRGSRKRIWLYDSFQGMPEAQAAKDGNLAVELSPGGRGGENSLGWGHEASARGVAERLRRLTGEPTIASIFGSGATVPQPDHNSMVTIREGWFNETFQTEPRPHGAIAFLFIDCDWYGSVVESLETFYDSVPPGGVIALDDFGYWEGARRALGDWLTDRNRQPGREVEFPLFERYGPDFLWWIKGSQHNRPAGSNEATK